MTDAEKIAKFHEIQKLLWYQAKSDNLLYSSMCAAIIRELAIESPDCEDPESA